MIGWIIVMIAFSYVIVEATKRINIIRREVRRKNNIQFRNQLVQSGTNLQEFAAMLRKRNMDPRIILGEDYVK